MTTYDEKETGPRELLLLRFSKNKSRWEGKDPDSDIDVACAAEDLALRPGEDYLSFYKVVDVAEGREVASAFKVTGAGRPDGTTDGNST